MMRICNLKTKGDETMYWLVFIAGLMLGGSLGVILMGIIIGGKMYDDR